MRSMVSREALDRGMKDKKYGFYPRVCTLELLSNSTYFKAVYGYSTNN
jgi:hypothetical protein